MIPVYNANFDMLAAHLEAVGRASEISALRSATNYLVAHVRGRARDAQAFLAAQADG